MKVKPLGNRVLIKPIEAEEKTKSGIYIPEAAKEKTLQATVVAVGPGARDDSGKIVPIDLKVGDKVVYEGYGGSEIKIENVKHLLMDAKDILAVIE